MILRIRTSVVRELRTVLLFMSLFLALLKPDSLTYIGMTWLDYSLVVFNVLVLLSLILMLLTKKYRTSLLTKFIILMYSTMALSTLVVSKDIITLIKTAGPAAAMCLFTDYSLQNKPKEFLRAAIYLLGILYFLNFVTIIIYYPEGLYQTEYVVGDLYLMGFDNGMIYNFIPLSALSLIYSKITKGRLVTSMSFVIIGLMFISEVFVKSGSGVVQALMFVILVFLAHRKLFNKLINPITLFGTFYVGSILLVFFRVQNYFADFIVGVLGKDLTLTGRTYLWDYAIMVIKDNFLIGVGAGGRTVLGVNGHAYMHPHSLLLDLLYKGGIIMLLLFVVATILFSYKYSRVEAVKIKKIVLIAVFIILFGEMANSMQYKVFFWSMFVMISYSDSLEKMSLVRNR